MPPIIHRYPRFERSKPRRVVSNWPVTGPGSMIFKVARKRRKPCKIYTRGPFLDSYRERVVPPRARSTWCGVGPAAEEKKRDTISFRPAGRSRAPFLSRNYEIASLKDPLRAPFSLFSFPSASLPIVSRHPSPTPFGHPLAPFFISSSFFLDVIAKSATHYPILPFRLSFPSP